MGCPRCGCRLRSRSLVRKEGVVCTDCGLPLDSSNQVLNAWFHWRQSLVVLGLLFTMLGLIWAADFHEAQRQAEPVDHKVEPTTTSLDIGSDKIPAE